MNNNIVCNISVNEEGNLITIKELAKMFNCKEEAIKKHIRELYPDLMQNGKTTYLNKEQVVEIKNKMTRTDNLQVKVVGELDKPIKTLDELKNLSKEENLKIGFTALQNVLEQLQNKKQTLQRENDDFKYLESDRLQKDTLRAKINFNVREKAKNGNYGEMWGNVYDLFFKSHNNIKIPDGEKKLDYLIRQGYGNELLSISLII
jgi:transposase